MIDNNRIEFTDINNFELKWRWLGGNYANFTPDILSKIKILDSKSSKYVYNKLEKYFSNYSLNNTFVKDIKSFEIRDSEILKKFWTKTRMTDDTQIIISWDENNCVITNWKIFKYNWDDFCYPSSDDVFIYPMNGDFIIYYMHEEIFMVGLIIK